MSYQPPPLTGEELVVLETIGADMRAATRGLAVGHKPLSGILAKRMGKRPTASLRAILALPDLTRPQPETLAEYARVIGRPDLVEVWRARWRSVPHPRIEVDDARQRQPA